LVQCRTRTTCNARGLSYGGGWIQGWFWDVADVTVMDLVAVISLIRMKRCVKRTMWDKRGEAPSTAERGKKEQCPQDSHMYCL